MEEEKKELHEKNLKAMTLRRQSETEEQKQEKREKDRKTKQRHQFKNIQIYTHTNLFRKTHLVVITRTLVGIILSVLPQKGFFWGFCLSVCKKIDSGYDFYTYDVQKRIRDSSKFIILIPIQRRK